MWLMLHFNCSNGNVYGFFKYICTVYAASHVSSCEHKCFNNTNCGITHLLHATPYREIKLRVNKHIHIHMYVRLHMHYTYMPACASIAFTKSVTTNVPPFDVFKRMRLRGISMHLACWNAQCPLVRATSLLVFSLKRVFILEAQNECCFSAFRFVSKDH